MKFLKIIAALSLLLAPLGAGAVCHDAGEFSFELSPERVGQGEALTFRTRFHLAAAEGGACADARNFTFIYEEIDPSIILEGGGERVVREVRTRTFPRDQVLNPAFDHTFNTPATGNGQTTFRVRIERDIPPGVIITASKTIFVLPGGTTKELSEAQKQGLGVPQARPTPLQVRIGELVEAASIPQYLSTVFNYVIRIVPLIAMLMIVVGGMQWLLAGGAPDKISEAKKRIANAVIGIILAFGTILLLQTVNPQILAFKELAIPRVAQQQVSGCVSGEIGCKCRETIGEAPAACNQNLFCTNASYVFASESEFYKKAIEGSFSGGAKAGAIAGLVTLGPIGAAAGALFGSTVGSIYGIAGGGTRDVCTDGKEGSPCNSSGVCEVGLECWSTGNLCFRGSARAAAGAVCNDGGDCASGECEAVILPSSWSASGGYPSWLIDFFGRAPKYCRGNTAARGSCKIHAECADGLFCIKPVEAEAGKCGHVDATVEADPCVVGAPAPYGQCDDGFACVYCPGSGDRLWTALTAQTEGAQRRLGQCKRDSPERRIVGQACGAAE